tara:strand:- start:14 stop:559 length:546 start_codon:yes stop_codon:yes gene_type:complete
MGDAKSLEEEKIDLYQKAQAVATAAIESDPENAGGYLRRAVAAGKLALYQGILQSRALVIQVKNDATNALELKSISSYRKALAHYLLGKVHLKLAEKPKALRIPLGLGWASKEKGEAYIEKAATRAPQSIPFNLEYAKRLLEQNQKKKAKALLEAIQKLKIADPDDPNLKKEAKQLLAELP